MDFVVVTGMSGALEDIGFFCVDNLLPELIEPFYQLSKTSEKERIAVVTDVRGGTLFAGLNDTLRRMEEAGNAFRLIFLDADDEILLRRYKETRRKHPLLDMFGGLPYRYDESFSAGAQKPPDLDVFERGGRAALYAGRELRLQARRAARSGSDPRRALPAEPLLRP